MISRGSPNTGDTSAEAFFATGEPSNEDKRDAIMELGNIAAGAVKILLGGEGEWSIGIPDSTMPASFGSWVVAQASAGGHIHLAFKPV